MVRVFCQDENAVVLHISHFCALSCAHSKHIYVFRTVNILGSESSLEGITGAVAGEDTKQRIFCMVPHPKQQSKGREYFLSKRHGCASHIY